MTVPSFLPSFQGGGSLRTAASPVPGAGQTHAEIGPARAEQFGRFLVCENESTAEMSALAQQLTLITGNQAMLEDGGATSQDDEFTAEISSEDVLRADENISIEVDIKSTSETLNIPGTGGEELAQRKTEIAIKLVQILDVARRAAEGLDSGTGSEAKKLRAIGTSAAFEIADFLIEFDTRTGANSVNVLRQALEVDLANTPQAIQHMLARDPSGALLQIVSGALGVALPVGHTLSIESGAVDGGGAAIYRSAEATLRQLARATQGVDTTRAAQGRAGEIDIRRIEMDNRIAAPSARIARTLEVAIEKIPFADSDGAEKLGEGTQKVMAISTVQDNHRIGESVRTSPTQIPPSLSAQSRLANSLANQIKDARLTAGAEGGRTRVELSPRGLGDLEIDLTTDPSGRVRIMIRAENPLVLDAMRADRDMLGDMLSGGRDRSLMDLDFGAFDDDRGEDEGEGKPLDNADTAEADVQPATRKTADLIGSGSIDIFT